MKSSDRCSVIWLAAVQSFKSLDVLLLICTRFLFYTMEALTVTLDALATNLTDSKSLGNMNIFLTVYVCSIDFVV